MKSLLLITILILLFSGCHDFIHDTLDNYYGGSSDYYSDTVVINGNATSTTFLNVFLTSNIEDAQQMSISNDGTTWSDWGSYNALKSWTLDHSQGTKTVWVKYLLSDNSEKIRSDSILYIEKCSFRSSEEETSGGSSVALSNDGLTFAMGSDVASGHASVFVWKISTWNEIPLTSEDTDSTSKLGYDVAIDSTGEKIAVSAPHEDGRTGTVYIFYKDTGGEENWGQKAAITASDGTTYDNFGYKLAMNGAGDRLVVSAPGTDASATDLGSVYFYTKDYGGSDNWGQVQIITAPTRIHGDMFGQAMVLSRDGSTLFISSIERDSGKGTVFIYTYSGSTYVHQQTINASDGLAEDYFGVSLALSTSGTVAAIGAWGDDHSSSGDDRGSVYIFENTSSSWSQIARITASDARDDDRFGYSTALSGDGTILKVGSYWADGTAGNGQGKVYSFVRSGNTYTESTIYTALDGSEGDHYGYDLSITSDGSILLIGAPQATVNSVNHSGAVYILR